MEIQIDPGIHLSFYMRIDVRLECASRTVVYRFPCWDLHILHASIEVYVHLKHYHMAVAPLGEAWMVE